MESMGLRPVRAPESGRLRPLRWPWIGADRAADLKPQFPGVSGVRILRFATKGMTAERILYPSRVGLQSYRRAGCRRRPGIILIAACDHRPTLPPHGPVSREDPSDIDVPAAPDALTGRSPTARITMPSGAPPSAATAIACAKNAGPESAIEPGRRPRSKPEHHPMRGQVFMSPEGSTPGVA